MALTDSAIRNAKPSGKQTKLFDAGGLFLLVSPTGGKWWRLKYRYAGKAKLLSLGTYPDVQLKQARKRRDAARSELASGIDPSASRKAARAASAGINSLETVAREWYSKISPTWAPAHARTTIQRLERDVFPLIGGKPIAEITAPELLTVLRRIENRGALETAHRTLQNFGQIFRYAVATGRASREPSADLRGALPPAKVEHLPAITDPRKIAELLRAVDGYKGSFVVKCALRLTPLVFVRPGELRRAEWSEFDFDEACWSLPREKMKMKQAHIVPLSRQAVAILREIHPLTGTGRYVFPHARTTGRPISENVVCAALRRMGFEKDEMSAHGWRATARTLMDEVLGVRPDFIEHQLAHAVRDPNGRAYNRTAYLSERKDMMQKWADYLDGLKGGAEIVPLRGRMD